MRTLTSNSRVVFFSYFFIRFENFLYDADALICCSVYQQPYHIHSEANMPIDLLHKSGLAIVCCVACRGLINTVFFYSRIKNI